MFSFKGNGKWPGNGEMGNALYILIGAALGGEMNGEMVGVFFIYIIGAG